MKKILVTGGCGFIGSCFVLKQIKQGNLVVNLDKLTYAADLENIKDVANNPNYIFVKGDICDAELVKNTIQKYEIDWLVNFAAESHVDNSIKSPGEFIRTNINGVYNLLNEALHYFNNLSGKKKEDFRFLHVSTDEVYGSLTLDEPAFTENNRYQPNSPYSASKAASDHLVRAWFETFNLPTITTNCSNNFGPRQHPEKFIPTIINSCINGKNIPIYGNGTNIRDWIYVEDHCNGIELALIKGEIGQTYCFGGRAEKQNMEVVNTICEVLDQIKPRSDKKSYKEQISFVEDRLGHDKRYAINDAKARRELGFITKKPFEETIKETVKWYLKVIPNPIYK